jgi:hypothetical protein
MKKTKKYHFIQDCGIFDYQFNVYIGWTKDEIVKDLVRFKEIDEMIKQVKECSFENIGGCIIYDDKSKRIMWLPKWTGKYQELSNLAHEIHHLVFMLAEQKGFQKEIESQAYLFQYLLDNIYKKLNGRSS